MINKNYNYEIKKLKKILNNKNVNIDKKLKILSIYFDKKFNGKIRNIDDIEKDLSWEIKTNT